MPRKDWSREALVVTLSLYLRLPFGKLDARTPEVQKLGELIGRSANSVAMRLNNFASLDPFHTNRGIKGLTNVSQGCREVWDEFVANREELIFESELAISKLQQTDLATTFLASDDLATIQTGEDRLRLLKTRVNQSVFREVVLRNYNSVCAISGVNTPDLLIASHIVPWAEDKEARLNPENGLCLSAIHDRAFDKGLITLDPDHRVVISPALKTHRQEAFYQDYFGRYEGQPIAPAGKYAPRPAFLAWHREQVFRA